MVGIAQRSFAAHAYIDGQIRVELGRPRLEQPKRCVSDIGLESTDTLL